MSKEKYDIAEDMDIDDNDELMINEYLNPEEI